jgi:hypothetical protein
VRFAEKSAVDLPNVLMVVLAASRATAKFFLV